jgi:hypothetical protein
MRDIAGILLMVNLAMLTRNRIQIISLEQLPISMIQIQTEIELWRKELYTGWNGIKLKINVNRRDAYMRFKYKFSALIFVVVFIVVILGLQSSGHGNWMNLFMLTFAWCINGAVLLKQIIHLPVSDGAAQIIGFFFGMIFYISIGLCFDALCNGLNKKRRLLAPKEKHSMQIR